MVKDLHKKTSLDYAIELGRIEVLKYLVKKGVDINAKGYKKQTPLQRAVSKGKLEVLKYLVEKGADIDAKD